MIPDRQNWLREMFNSDLRRWNRYFAPGVCSAVCIISGLVSRSLYYAEFARVQYDDSYITYRYAQNLLNGNGLRFNPGDNTNSASSLIFTLALAVTKFITRLPMMDVATLLNFLGLGIIGGCIGFVSRLAVKSLLPAVAFAALVAQLPQVGLWLNSGMETIFFIGLVVGFLTFADQSLLQNFDTSWRRVIGVLLCAALVGWTRVEGIIVVAVVLTTAGLFLVGTKRRLGTGRYTLHPLTLLGVAPALAGAQLLFYRVYYGISIPDPIRFKDQVLYYSRSASQSADAIREFILVGLRPVAALAVGYLVTTIVGRRSRAEWLVLSRNLALLAVYSLYLTRAPHSDYFRYELILVVPLVMVVITGIKALAEIPKSWVLLVSTFALVATIFGIQTTIERNQSLANQVKPYLYVQAAREAAGKWMATNTPPNSRVLSSDIGAVAFFNMQNVYLDVAGLANREQLNAVISKQDLFLAVTRRSPQYIVDTVGSDEILSVEKILSTPEAYYVDGRSIPTSCKKMPTFDRERMGSWPENATGILRIDAYQINDLLCFSE